MAAVIGATATSASPAKASAGAIDPSAGAIAGAEERSFYHKTGSTWWPKLPKLSCYEKKFQQYHFSKISIF